ncbi:hypothetical protein GTQ45_03745 [Pyruvatibacter mobilis]|uniref:Uncharacterized protein n=1 Tax=Pyruvatibacter mobilis TaxID=1712261 RepID=A0A845Q9T5_9HYPH|nr:hypothetical protein [Pyruvatibacter mobilis]NBG94841.1 hypothetical protein [Pyruvatibacter mobilis]QJD76062.1 hypothetical protein HG718_11970 [Pyruvatibacter mobilis]GGD20853.1 hypothetical protein GCM10011587_26790 [Pyruvatibacter mobilis]
MADESSRVNTNRRLYGQFIIEWQMFECILEVAIRDILKISYLHAHTVLGSLQFKTKASIAKALLQQRGREKDKKAIRLINKITREARRNALIHSIVWEADDGIEFVKRDVDDKLKVRSKTFRGKFALGMHLIQLEAGCYDLCQQLGITGASLHRYRQAADKLLDETQTLP